MSLELGPGATHFGARLCLPGRTKAGKQRRKFFTLWAAPVRGCRPASLEGRGDEEFEKSRHIAQVQHDLLAERIRERRDPAATLRQLYAIEMGTPPPRLALPEVPEAYVSLPRTRPLVDRYAAQVRSKLDSFIRFIGKNYPEADHLAAIRHEMVLAFLKTVEATGVSEGTYNDVVKLLKGVFTRLRRQAGVVDNPVEGIPLKEETVVHRLPFDIQQLQCVIENCLLDSFIGPIVIVMLCTALRRGKACQLDWSQVNLAAGFIALQKPGKKGGPVDIPIFPLLRKVLEDAGPKESGPVFPAQKVLYLESPDSITAQVRKLLVRAGFDDDESRDNDLSVKHPTGLRRVSVRGSHSCRVTWITLALASGVPVEVVQKVTGHKIVETVLTHYFQPGRSDLRDILEHKLPQLLIGAGVATESPAMIVAKLRLVVDQLRPDNAAAFRIELVQLIDRLATTISATSNAA